MTNPHNQCNDPYAPPPRYREKSGAVLRVAILGALLAGAAWGYMQFANAPQTARVEPAAEEQMMTEARDQVQAPNAQPAATPVEEPTPAPRAPRQAAPAEPTPPATTTIEPASPQPLPPVDMPSGE